MRQRIPMEDITYGLGRLKTSVSGNGKTVEYVYDEADNLAEIKYPDGYSVKYEYGKNDNNTKLTDRDGRNTIVTRPGESVSNYYYNARNQILEAENLCACGQREAETLL